MGQFWIVKEKSHIDERVEHFRRWLQTEFIGEHPIMWEPQRYKAKRSLSQNSLFHLWCREMSQHFSDRGADINEERMKELLCYKFLGTEDRKIGQTIIEAQVRHTSDLSPGEMTDFMDQCIAWALDHGVKLSNPPQSEYMRMTSGT
jgi:hypothetical protein